MGICDVRGALRPPVIGVALVLALSPAFAVAQPAAGDYTQWRGPQRDGSSAAFTAPKVWPDALTGSWQVEVGAGYATPLLVGARVYTLARQGGEEVMMALDAATGTTIWRTAYPAPYKTKPGTQTHGDGPKSTPLFHGGRLFTLGISGIVSAFDASDGTILWQKPAPAVDPMFGTAMSPIADGDLVFFHVGGHDQGALTAFNATTGEVTWAWPGDGPSYGSPMLVDLEGVRQLVTITQQNVVGIDPATGTLLWERPFIALASTNSFTPVIFDGTVIVSAHDAGVVAFKPVHPDGGWAVEGLWDTTEVEMKLSNPVVVGDTLYGLSHKNSGQLFALDPRTGQVLWRGEEREAAHGSFVKAGGLIFLLNEEARLSVATGAKDGLQILKTYEVADSAAWAQPTVSGNRIFAKDDSTITLWTVQ